MQKKDQVGDMRAFRSFFKNKHANPPTAPAGHTDRVCSPVADRVQPILQAPHKEEPLKHEIVRPPPGSSKLIGGPSRLLQAPNWSTPQSYYENFLDHRH
jgi:hypothetical protein